MIVSGARGILFNPDTVYAIENSDGKYDIIVENKATQLHFMKIYLRQA